MHGRKKKTSNYIFFILFRILTTRFGLGDYHKAIITIILIIRGNAVQIKLVSCENSAFQMTANLPR